MNRKTLKKVEKALGIKLYDWQRDYIMLESDFIPDVLFGKLNESTLFKLITPVFGIKCIDI